MNVTLIECLVGLNLVLLGWLHMRQNRQGKLLETKVDKEDFQEVRADIKEILNSVIDIKVETARWQGQMERAASNKRGKS